MIRATSALLAQPYGVSARSATPIWSRSDLACAWTWASIPLRGVTVCARHIILHGAAVLVASRPRRARRYFGYFVHVRLWPYSPPPRAPNRPYLATYLEQALQQQIDVDDRVPSFLLCWPLCLVGVAVARELVARGPVHMTSYVCGKKNLPIRYSLSDSLIERARGLVLLVLQLGVHRQTSPVEFPCAGNRRIISRPLSRLSC
jgi:hypothetical protein